MAYSLKLHEERVIRYLREFPSLSRQCRIRLFAHLHEDLGEHGDRFRSVPGRRVAAEAPYFWYQLVLKDNDGDGRIRQFSFIVDDSAAAFGVLQVEYVEVV